VWKELARDLAFEKATAPAAHLPLIHASQFSSEERIKSWSFCDYLLRRDPALLLALDKAGIDAKNELRHTPSHLIDIMATCVDVGGASYPKENDGHAITPMQGHTLTTVFNGTGIMSRYLFWEHEGNAAVRLGDMKLVRTGRNGPWELYDLKTDRTEQHDLAAAQPEKVTELAAEWQKWAERSQVLPYPGEGQGKKKKGKGKKKAE
jgi:arylsulfatase